MGSCCGGRDESTHGKNISGIAGQSSINEVLA